METVKDTQKDGYNTNQTGSMGLDSRYVVLKIEKLTAALHLVTSFLSNSDPIKYKLRDLGLLVMHNSLSLKHTDDQYKTVILDDLKRDIGNLTSFISVALADSSVSQMNLTILKKEYNDLYNYLDRYQVNQDSLVGKVELPKPTFRPNPTQTLPKGEGLNTYTDRNLSSPTFPSGRGSGGGVVSGSINTERRDLIINFVKDNGWSAINEIAKAVPDVSDKTVQRELVAMVNEGILIKKGDRRWSRYSLAQKA